MNVKSLSTIAFTCFIGVVAHGQTPETPPVAPSPPIDRSAGMAIETMRSAIQTRFERMDTNGDGFLTKNEFPERRGSGNRSQRPSGDGASRGRDQARAGDRPRQRQDRMPIRWRSFEEYDSDKDGQVSKEEMAAPVDELAALDSNGDGRIDRTEMRAIRESRDAAKQVP